jgi:hypothetical protein
MSLKNYIFLMLLATLACYFAFGAVIYFFDPFAGGFLAILFFYFSLLLALIGTLSLVGLFLRLIFSRNKLIFKQVVTSFRQSIWFSILIIIILYLQKIDLFAWKNLIFLILAFAILELFFISYKTKHSAKI